MDTNLSADVNYGQKIVVGPETTPMDQGEGENAPSGDPMHSRHADDEIARIEDDEEYLDNYNEDSDLSMNWDGTINPTQFERTENKEIPIELYADYAANVMGTENISANDIANLSDEDFNAFLDDVRNSDNVELTRLIESGMIEDLPEDRQAILSDTIAESYKEDASFKIQQDLGVINYAKEQAYNYAYSTVLQNIAGDEELKAKYEKMSDQEKAIYLGTEADKFYNALEANALFPDALKARNQIINSLNSTQNRLAYEDGYVVWHNPTEIADNGSSYWSTVYVDDTNATGNYYAVHRNYDRNTGNVYVVDTDQITQDAYNQGRSDGEGQTYCNLLASKVGTAMGAMTLTLDPVTGREIKTGPLFSNLESGTMRNQFGEYVPITSFQDAEQLASAGYFVVASNPGHVVTLTGGYTGGNEVDNLNILRAGGGVTQYTTMDYERKIDFRGNIIRFSDTAQFFYWRPF